MKGMIATMTTKTKEKKKSAWIMYGLFFVGLFVMIYPLISRTYYDFLGNEEVTQFEEERTTLPTAEILERLQQAYAYNSALLSSETASLGDPFSEQDKEEGVTAYADLLEISEKIGVLTIPKLNMKFPVYAGTSETVLQKGVGHLEGTSLPIGGLSTHSVLTAHRGLPENKLFTDLDKLKIADLFFIDTIAGQLAYEVIEVKVIEPTAIEELRIQKDKDLVTLLTCTPYMINSQRLLVIGERTTMPKEEQEKATNIRWWEHWLSLLSGYIWIIAFGILLSVVLVYRRKWKKRKE